MEGDHGRSGRSQKADVVLLGLLGVWIDLGAFFCNHQGVWALITYWNEAIQNSDCHGTRSPESLKPETAAAQKPSGNSIARFPDSAGRSQTLHPKPYLFGTFSA